MTYKHKVVDYMAGDECGLEMFASRPQLLSYR